MRRAVREFPRIPRGTPKPVVGFRAGDDRPAFDDRARADARESQKFYDAPPDDPPTPPRPDSGDAAAGGGGDDMDVDDDDDAADAAGEDGARARPPGRRAGGGDMDVGA